MILTEKTRQLIDRLVELLDDEISLLDQRISQLKRLSPLLARRDEHEAEAIMDEIEQAQHSQQLTDESLHRVRVELAELLNLEAEELKLSRLIEMLSPVDGEPIRARRETIVTLAQNLRAENLKAAVVLSQCAHLNQLLMQSIMPRSSRVTTYSADGMNSWQAKSGLVDAKG